MLGRNEITQKVLDEIKAVAKRLAKVEGQLDVAKEQLQLSKEIVSLKKQLVNLEIERDKKQEMHAREKREVRHEVGLLRKQVETEQELATERAKLEVREENLQADRDRFEEQMKFTTARFEKEVEYLHSLAGQILERLPHVEVNKKLDFRADSNGHGAKEEVEA